LKIDTEIWPILVKAATYINTGSHSDESIDGCRHLFMAVWMQLGLDLSKLLLDPNNPMSNFSTGATVSFSLDEALQNLEKFLLFHTDEEDSKSASS